MAVNGDEKHHRAVIGNEDSFWIYDSRTGFDLTHPPKPDSPPVKPRVSIKTSTSPITVDPAKSALIVIDMQNYFLSSALGRKKGPGHAASDQLVENAIPACRKAGIRILWVNWGLTEKEVDDMPPAAKRANGFDVIEDDGSSKLTFAKIEDTIAVDSNGSRKSKDKDVFKGYGRDLGKVTDPETGKEIDAGPMLMRDAWNSDLYPPLDKIYQEGKQLPTTPDVWIHKNRMSGMWGVGTDLEVFLQKEGLKTLFFAGVNTDQCVGGTFQDCFSKGYDCVLLSDGCGTTSTKSGQECVEWNAENVWGFKATCGQLREGVEGK